MNGVQLTDTVNNTRVAYLYVSHFEWLDAAANETHVGHPKIGRVYRSILNTATKSHRLFYDIEGRLEGMYLSMLDTDVVDGSKDYDAEIVELRSNNILEYEITEEDLDNLILWEKEENKTIKQYMGLDKQAGGSESAPLQQTLSPQQVMQHINDQEANKAFMQLGAFLKRLADTDPQLFEALSILIYSVADNPEEDTTIDRSWMAFSAVLGPGKNISKAIDALARYGGEDRRTNLDEKDLIKAIKALLIEMVRIQLHP